MPSRSGAGVGGLLMGLVAFALASNCASIKSERLTTDTPTRTVVKLEQATAPPTLTASATVRGTALAVRILQAQTCELKTIKMVNRVEFVKKTTPTFGIAASVLGAAVLGGLGAWMYFDAEAWASRGGTSNSNGTTRKLTGDDFRVGGIVVASAALVPLAIAVIDAIRAIDTRTDLGEITASTDTKIQPCNEKPVADQLARIGTEVGPSTRTTGDGLATFQFKDAPLRALPRERTPVQVGDMTTTVDLASDEVAALVDALRKDPTSAVAVEEHATRERSCKELVRSATDARATDRESDDEAAARRWEMAQEGCGELWTPEAAAARDRFDAAYDKRKGERQRRACKTALDEAELAISQNHGAAEAIDIANKACDGRGATAALKAKLEKARAAEAKEAAVAQERDNVLEMLRERAFDAALRKVRQAPSVCAAPRAGEDEAFVRILDQAALSAINPVIGAVGAGREPEPAEVQQLCLARTFFIECQGQEEWRRAVAAMTGGVAKVDPLKTGKVVKALNSGTCVVGGTK